MFLSPSGLLPLLAEHKNQRALMDMPHAEGVMVHRVHI